MTHPDDRIVLNIFEDRRVLFDDLQACLAILVVIGRNDLAAKMLCNQLHSVTDTQNRQSQFPDALIGTVCIFRIDRSRPS